MGRHAKIKSEPTTSLTVFRVDSMLLDDFVLPDETKTEALRRIFITFFTEAKVKAKKEELIKKLVRQQSIPRAVSDQKTFDNVFYPNKTFKDLEYTKQELAAMIKEARRCTEAEAENSILKAVNREDAIETQNGYSINREWWKETAAQQLERIAYDRRI